MIFIINLIHNFVYIYSIILTIYALLSWFPNAYNSTLGRFITAVTEPYLKVFRRLPLRIGGLDLTVWVAIFSLNILYQLFVRIIFFLL
ncbi:MAG: YggT family protein [Streptococcus sp.]|nr:YggT family protein [Streptococcus sp.]